MAIAEAIFFKQYCAMRSAFGYGAKHNKKQERLQQVQRLPSDLLDIPIYYGNKRDFLVKLLILLGISAKISSRFQAKSNLGKTR